MDILNVQEQLSKLHDQTDLITEDYQIMFECKKQKIDIDTLVNEHGFPSILSLSFDEATIIINQLTK